MSLIGQGLRALHVLSGVLVAGSVVMGYMVGWGLDIGQHIATAFFSGLVITFTHTMTIFYFFGTAVEMREASGSTDCGRRGLEKMARCRRAAVLPLSLALVSLATAIILGGGSHTRAQPAWIHHTVALAAVALNLYANRLSIRVIGANESAMKSVV